MGRLQEILQERAMIDAIIDGKKFKKYTDVGNLFRLMLVNNKDHEFPIVGKQNLVSSMLPDIIQDEEKNVKALQTNFNKIKKIVKVGKKPTVAVKKLYYSMLFSLLLPMTGNAKLFKASTLATKFASDAAASQTFQRKAIVQIGRYLLKSDIADLNTKDEQAIRAYIMGLDELDKEELNSENNPMVTGAVESEDKNVAPEEQQPKSKVDTLVNSETTDDELDQYINNGSIIEQQIDNVKQFHEQKAADIAQMLQTNKTSEIFKVTDEGIDSSVQAVINTKIDSVFNDTKAAMGIQTANFVTKFIKDTIDNLNSVKGFINFNADSLRFSVRPGQDSFVINVAAGDPRNGSDELFFMDRSFYKDANGNLNVKNDQLQIPQSLQGTSINKDIFSDALDLYKAQGVTKIHLEANVDVGGYAWFRYGFTPEDTKQIKKISLWIKDVLPMVYSALQYDAEDVGNFIVERTNDKSQDIINLSELLKGGQTPDAEKVLQKLAKSCSKEFETTYNSKESFKTMFRDIALKNFKSITHGGKKYAMSYKALLSIQALRDDTGFAIVPMSNGVYLNWLGELDMNNLDNTLAYLNKA